MAYTTATSLTATPRSNPVGVVNDSAGSFAQTPAVSAATVGPAKPKLLDRLREGLRTRHYSRRTEETYCHWVTHVLNRGPAGVRSPVDAL